MPRNEARQAGKRPLRALTPQEKMDAINRVHNGESKAAVARDIGVPESTLRGWCKAEQKIITQVNNTKTSGPSLSGTSLTGYEHILTSSSDNSNNSGAGSSSRSTPTAQATMLGLGSASGIAEKAEEFEAGPSHKRIKVENSSASMINNISTSARAPLTNDTIFHPYLYNMMSVDPSKTLALLNSFIKPAETLLSYPPYSPTANLLTDSLLPRNNSTMTNMTIANMLKQHQQQPQQQQPQQQQQQQPQTSNTLLNGTKKKHSAPGLSSTMDIPKPSSRTQNNQSPNAEKSSASVSQPNNQLSMPSTSSMNSSSDAVSQPKTSRSGKSLNSIIDSLLHPYVPPPNSVKKEVIFDAPNNNNNDDDDMDNETARKNYPDSLPPRCHDMVEYCVKLLDWLHDYGAPVSTMKQVGHIQSILWRLNDWIDKKSKKELPQRTNGTS